MKKLFICALALASVVACSKDDTADAVLTSSQKSVSVTIANAVSSTRAVDALTADEVTLDENGSVGKVLDAGQNVVSAQYTELVFLFANKNGEIVEIRRADQAAPSTVKNETNEVHTLTFHAVTEAAMQLAVVKYGDMTALQVGDNLSKVRDEAADEAKNNEINLNMITLYGVDDLEANGTCEYDGHEYNLYKAVVDIAPLFARFEISGIECSDLGYSTLGMALNTIEPTVATKGYDELTLNSLTFGANNKYSYEWSTKPVLLGQYSGNINDGANGVRPDYQDTRIYAFDSSASSTLAAEGVTNTDGSYTANNATTMLAWNIAQQDAFTEANPLVLNISTKAYDYINATKESTVTVTGLTKDNAAVTTFEAGNIYRLYLEFEEKNIDSYPDGLCVNVQVTVAKWVVNIVNPTFKTN